MPADASSEEVARAGGVELATLRSRADRGEAVASMFGNTTWCVEAARAVLEAAGFKVLVFHATGTGPSQKTQCDWNFLADANAAGSRVYRGFESRPHQASELAFPRGSVGTMPNPRFTPLSGSLLFSGSWRRIGGARWQLPGR